jgi:hypothetical protein
MFYRPLHVTQQAMTLYVQTCGLSTQSQRRN